MRGLSSGPVLPARVSLPAPPWPAAQARAEPPAVLPTQPSAIEQHAHFDGVSVEDIAVAPRRQDGDA